MLSQSLCKASVGSSCKGSLPLPLLGVSCVALLRQHR